MIFDGREYALEKEKALQSRVDELKENGVTPRIASILASEDPASRLYVNLKKKKADELGIEMDVYKIEPEKDALYIKELIEKLNEDKSVAGIMIQLPLDKKYTSETRNLIDTIDKVKDVDGLKGDSPYLHPTSKAVIEIIDSARQSLGKDISSVAVVGATGMVGKPLCKKLREIGYDVIECTKDSELSECVQQGDVVVSATGQPNLINGDMISEGAILVDVGSPKGDFDFESVRQKASFVTPVPGGVGPVTILCLFENLLEAAA